VEKVLHALFQLGRPVEKPRFSTVDGASHPAMLHFIHSLLKAKLMTRVGEEFPLECPGYGGDIRLRGDRREEPAPAK